MLLLVYFTELTQIIEMSAQWQGVHFVALHLRKDVPLSTPPLSAVTHGFAHKGTNWKVTPTCQS